MDLVDAAVFNNATWCDAVCRALGRRTRMRDGFWVNLDPSPPFYSNAIALRPGDMGSSFARVRDQVDAGVPGRWSVKDSYAQMNLGRVGFEALFEATWIALPVGGIVATSDPTDLRWERVDVCERIVRLGGGMARNAGERRGSHSASDLHAVASRRPGHRVPGRPPGEPHRCGRDRQPLGRWVGSRAGISNIVLPEAGGEIHRPGVVAAVRSAFPDLPMVGYERGDDLDAMESIGFKRLGPLRVWIKG